MASVTDGDPQADIDRQACARHMLQHPLTCAEHDPEIFRMIRRHETNLDQWFTQRLGYRLHLDADTARLYKIGYVPEGRPLRTKSERPFHRLEYVMLSLVLASTAAGPAVISLRDLVAEIRSAAAEADIALANDVTERRAIVTVLRWMIDHGLASELHEHIDTYMSDEVADAVLRIRPDRIALLPVAALVGSSDAATLLDRADHRQGFRQWMRRRLVEDPVLYRDDLDESEWSELRRRLGEERQILDEMFGLVLEVRAEGVAAIDPRSALGDQRFPSGGTAGHAALLLIERLGTEPATNADVMGHMHDLLALHGKRWSNEYTSAPEKLARDVTTLLCNLRLAVRDERTHGEHVVRLLPAAARFVAIEPTTEQAMEQATEQNGSPGAEQDSLW